MTFTSIDGHLNHRRENWLTRYRQEGRSKKPKWQFPERKRKGLLWGLGRDLERERNTCVSEELEQEGQLSGDGAKADKKGNRTRAGRSLGLTWKSATTV